MALDQIPGNALFCIVNSHRSGWDGKVCEGAAGWNCGAKQRFREDYCAHSETHC